MLFPRSLEQYEAQRHTKFIFKTPQNKTNSESTNIRMSWKKNKQTNNQKTKVDWSSTICTSEDVAYSVQ